MQIVKIFKVALVDNNRLKLEDIVETFKKSKHQQGGPVPKNLTVDPTYRKVVATVFWDSQGALKIDYKPKGTNIGGDLKRCVQL